MTSGTERLLGLLRDRSLKRGTVTLASGKTSDFFIDCKQTVLLAEGHVAAAQALLPRVYGMSPEPVAVAGVELGGCPLASAVAMESHRRGKPLDAVYVRKNVKDHGSQRGLEGDTHLPRGAPVAVVEDVVTTGGSTLRAVERVRQRGLQVVGVVALVDRLEGGAESLAAHGIPFQSLFTRADFV